MQAQIDELVRRIAANRGDIDTLGTRADESDIRADAAEARADAAEVRTDNIEARVRIDHDLIIDLQAEGILSREHALQLEEALKSSRVIGTAIGVIMASRDVGEDDAFTVLKVASQNSNRKLREVATDLVNSAHLPGQRQRSRI